MSNGFDVLVVADAARRRHVVPDSVKINGVPVNKTAPYRVAMNNFLASGGDGFTVFNEGTDPLGGEIDLDAAGQLLHAQLPGRAGAAEPHHAGPVGPKAMRSNERGRVQARPRRCLRQA